MRDELLMSHYSNVMPQKENDRELKKVFDVFDVDGSGYITNDKLRIIAREIMKEHVSEEVIDCMILVADKDCDGRVTFEEFKALFQ